MKRFLGLLWLITGLAVSLAAPSTAYACTPPPGGLPTFTVSEYVEASTLVVEGIVATVSDDSFPQIVTIEVTQYIKGNGPAVITVSGYGPGSVCLSQIYTGDHFIFYIETSPEGVYHALYLSQFDAVEQPSPENIAEAIIASGQTPVVITPDSTVLTAVAAASITPTDTPTPFDESSLAPAGIEAVFTEAWATHQAALAAEDSAMATASFATIEAAYTQLSLAAVSPTPTPFPPPIGQPVPVVTQVAPTAMEAVGLIGVGVVIGLIIGVLIGVVIGLFVGRWRE